MQPCPSREVGTERIEEVGLAGDRVPRHRGAVLK